VGKTSILTVVRRTAKLDEDTGLPELETFEILRLEADEAEGI
jgi:hypothetical protein